MVKLKTSITPTGRIAQQIGVKPYARATITPQVEQQIRQTVSPTQPTVDYNRAWEEARKHWLKGKAGAYLYFMKKEARKDPQTGAVYAYVKELDKQTRAGNISPGRAPGSLLAVEEYRAAITPQIISEVIPPTIEEKPLALALAPSVPSDFIGPLPLGVTRRPAVDGRIIPEKPTTVPSTFVGPLQLGVTREPDISLKPYRLTLQDIAGTGKVTKAVDVGGGKMQDFVITYSTGRIISAEPIGKPIPQSQRFKEAALKKDIFATEYFKKKDEYKPGKADIFFFEKIFGTDPSLTPIPKYKAGEEFSLRYGHMWAGVKLSDWWVKQLEKEGRLEEAELLKKPAPKWLAGAVAEFPAWATFAPFMKTGAAQIQESKYVYDVKAKRFVKKSMLKDYLEEPKVNIAGKKITIKDLTYSDKASRINLLLSKTTTIEGRKAVIKLAQETYGKSFVKEFAAQEFGVYIPVTTTPSPAPLISKPPTEFLIPKLPKMEKLEYLETVMSSLFQPSKVGQTQWVSSAFMQQPAISFLVPPQTIPDVTTGQIQDVTTVTTGQAPAPPVQIPKIPIPIPTPQIPAISPIIRAPAIPKPKVPKRPPKKRRPFLLWAPSLEPIPLVKKKKPTSYIPQVRSKNKWETVGKRMDRNSALSRASRGADLSISRRMRILPSNKPVQVTGIRGWGMRQHKFRPYRKTRGRKIKLQNEFIEKSQFAIDTPTEVRGLSISKLSKNMGWLAPTRSGKKRKTQKRKSKSPWLV